MDFSLIANFLYNLINSSYITDLLLYWYGFSIIIIYFFIYFLFRFIFNIFFIKMRRLPKFYRGEIIYIYVLSKRIIRIILIYQFILNIFRLFKIDLYSLKIHYVLFIFGFFGYVFIIILSLLKYIIMVYIELSIEKNPSLDRYKIRTLGLIFERSLATIIICIFVFIFLSMLGISILPLINAVGFIAGSISFTSKTLITDIINGIFILYDDSLKIGDLIDFEGKTAIVEDMRLRYIRVRLDDGLLVTIPFHQIDIIKNKTRIHSYIVLNISLNIKTDINIAEKAIQEAFTVLRNRPEYKYTILKEIEARDIADITGFSFVMQYRICTSPEWHNRIRRAFNKELKLVFQKYEIYIANPIVANVMSVPSVTTADPYPDFY